MFNAHFYLRKGKVRTNIGIFCEVDMLVLNAVKKIKYGWL